MTKSIDPALIIPTKTMSAEDAKRSVLKKWPDALVEHRSRGRGSKVFLIWAGNGQPDKKLGHGETEPASWIDAAERIGSR